MTPEEISILKQAYNIRKEEQLYMLHLDKWLGRAVTATDKKGEKYIYKSFDEFYTYDKDNLEQDGSKNIRKRSKNAVVDENYSAKRTTEDLVKIALNLRALNERKNLDS